MRRGGRVVLALLVAIAAESPHVAEAQELGHKTLGTLGLRAGAQPAPGVYLANRFVSYRADALFDRDGNELPVGLHAHALAGAFGASVSFEVPAIGTYVNAGFGLPMAHVVVETKRPEASVDRFGFGDIYVQPLRLGWRLPHLDVVAGYAFYAPTGRFEAFGSGGIGQGQWTHEPSLGATIYVDDARTWQLSALASYDRNGWKRGIAIRRGDTIQIQGGLGWTPARVVDVGVAAHALWQVDDDEGDDVPAALRGARDRTFGVGPEVAFVIPQIGTRLTTRYERDFGVTSRPRGGIFVVGVTVLVWSLGDAPR